VETRTALRALGRVVALVSGALLLAGAVLAGLRGAPIYELLWQWSIAEWSVGWAFAAVGAILTTRRERHPIAWLCAAIGLSAAMTSFAGQLHATLQTAGASPFVSAVLDLTHHRGPIIVLLPDAFALLALLLLLFPSGRPPSPRWRWLIYAIVAAIGVAELADWGVVPERVYNLADIVWLAALPVGAASLAWRLRRADATERQQIKIVAFATVVVIVGFLAGGFGGVAPVTNALLLPVIPASFGVAILRYRLYDIDRIISRTLAWALLTGVLVVVYLGSTLVLGSLLRPWTGQSTIAVAGSTLIVAALVRPLHSHLQSTVDRHFYRSRHDAVRAVEAFRHHLRDETNLDQLSAGVAMTIARALEPTDLTIWLLTRTPTAYSVGDRSATTRRPRSAYARDDQASAAHAVPTSED